MLNILYYYPILSKLLEIICMVIYLGADGELHIVATLVALALLSSNLNVFIRTNILKTRRR